MESYVALLRGINVGGNKKVPMAELREVLGAAGLENPRTLLASGNAVFNSGIADTDEIEAKVVQALDKAFPFEIPVSIHRLESFRRVVEMAPFGEVTVTPDTRLYVTFLKTTYTGTPDLPYEGADGSFHIIGAWEEMVFSYLQLDLIKTVDAMVVLDKMFGKGITTRNWNTVVKISNL